MKLLLIEDDHELSQVLQNELSKYFVVESAYTGEEGDYKALVNIYDLYIIDYVLPDITGVEIVKKIRFAGIKSPIIIVTGQDEIAQKIEGFDAGADDYITKPFHFQELHARIKAVLRRESTLSHSNILTVGDLTLDLDKKIVMRQGMIISLRRKELYLLEYLMRNAGNVVTREMIFDHVWDSENESMTNIIDVHIRYLRSQVDLPFNKRLIKTVHGLGYKIEVKE